jgi:hypothetical protein
MTPAVMHIFSPANFNFERFIYPTDTVGLCANLTTGDYSPESRIGPDFG